MALFTETESFLRRAHALFPAETPKWFDRPLDGGTGDSSYDRLAACVSAPGRVLDLACGDGVLTERVLARHPSARVVAVDLSEVELDFARRRLAGRPVTLALERAHALSLEDGSVDTVLCHMALMLMAPLEGALREVGRVLRPGGTFAAVVGRGWRPGPIQELFREGFRQALGEHGGTPIGALGDERTRTREGLTAALAASRVFSGKPDFEEWDLTLRLTPGELAEFMMGAYDTVVLSEKGRGWLRGRLEQGLLPLADGGGRVTHGMGLRLVRVTR